MRNSFSLSVLFPTVLELGVKIVFMHFIASRKMKLVSVLYLTIGFTVDAVQDHFSLLSKFQTPSPEIFSTDNSIYLPSESSTPGPLFPIKNNNKLPFTYIPLTGIRDHLQFNPTPFPNIMSSTVLTPIGKDVDDENYDRRPSPGHQFLRNNVNPYIKSKANFTENNQENQKTKMKEKIPQKIKMYQPIDRIDMNLLNQFTMNNGPTTPYGVMHTPTARSMIISTDTLNEPFKPDHYQNYQNVQVPKFYITPTTETAIPILRLSNEMDLDGSFSYEALGADQTHYVQHSRIENFGSDTQEQVVEGSYSYVGDNGQTYTVNYTADSNGFRASGDHLPVPPPIPEIIQRSIQYNLANEARMPPDVKFEEKETEAIGNEKRHLFAVSPQHLFTGRTPESFSFGFPEYNIPNNLIASASTQAPMKGNIELIQDYINAKPSGTISPQITFLASQGAHAPSLNSAEQTMSRFNSAHRPTMQQLINYEAPMKDSDQEGNKGLWRWQYGQNTESHHIPEKNTISRSYGEDDDIMINFNDMTSDQYANMFKSQLVNNQKRSDYSANNELYRAKDKNKHPIMTENYNFVPVNNEKEQVSTSTETVITSTQFDNWHKRSENNNIQNKYEAIYPFQTEASATVFKSKITHPEYIPFDQVVTQSNDYDNTFFEPKRIHFLNTDATSKSEINKLNFNKNAKADDLWLRTNDIDNISKVSTTQEPFVVTSEASPFKLTKFIISENNNGFTPLLNVLAKPLHDQQTDQPTTETVEDIYKENIFLKRIFSNHNNHNSNDSQLKDESKVHYHRKSDKESKNPKFTPLQSYPLHEIKSIRRMPLDIADILNYISAKNQFESSKISPKFQQAPLNNFEERYENRPISLQHNRHEDESKNVLDYNRNDYRNHERLEEMRGLIKNYKILQRNNDVHNREKDIDKIKRVSPPPQGSNLPPLGRAGPTMKSYLPPIYA